VLATAGTSGALTGHFCSAAVVASPAGDLVITAAHCLAGHQAGQFVFVPGYDRGRAPYGGWQVNRIFIDNDWSSRSDPDDDVAFIKPRSTTFVRNKKIFFSSERAGVFRSGA
jgi:V8-like Glu-specific endopeptidase